MPWDWIERPRDRSLSLNTPLKPMKISTDRSRRWFRRSIFPTSLFMVISRSNADQCIRLKKWSTVSTFECLWPPDNPAQLLSRSSRSSNWRFWDRPFFQFFALKSILPPNGQRYRRNLLSCETLFFREESGGCFFSVLKPIIKKSRFRPVPCFSKIFGKP